MNWWNYLLLVNIYLVLFYGFYVLLLRRETFFQLNRVYLVAAALLSFFIPLIQSDWVRNLFITQRVQYTIYNSPVMFYQFTPIQHTQITFGQVVMVVYLIGIVFLVGRFAWQLFKLGKIIGQPQPGTAYSFFKKVSLGNNLANHKAIAAHEQAHAGQWHSADILMIEMVMIINWFNPVVYFYRFAIKYIHEFIADRQAIKSGTDKADYALLLLSQTFNTPAHRLVNPFFNHSLLKQRIMMLQKNKSNRVALAKYGLSAPLFILMLVLSSATITNSRTVRLFNDKAGEMFLIPATTGAGEIDAGDIDGRNSAFSQVQHPTQKDDKIFSAVEHVPEFPGGINAFGKYLAKSIRYPSNARKNNVQGRVIISFVVEKDGSLSNVRVARGVESDIDAEASRVIRKSPKWTPGKQNGHLVRVAYSVPIAFTLADARPVIVPTGHMAVPIHKSASVPNKAITAVIIKPNGTKDTEPVYLTNTSGHPLIMVDGVETNDLKSLNPNDIESISVLKDKSATALYGPKGTAGVIVVTTKKIKQKPKPASF
jgi:TonB family protein